MSTKFGRVAFSRVSAYSALSDYNLTGHYCTLVMSTLHIFKKILSFIDPCEKKNADKKYVFIVASKIISGFDIFSAYFLWEMFDVKTLVEIIRFAVLSL